MIHDPDPTGTAIDALAVMQAALEAADAAPVIFDEQLADVPDDAMSVGDGFFFASTRGTWTVDAAGILAALDALGYTVVPKPENVR